MHAQHSQPPRSQGWLCLLQDMVRATVVSAVGAAIMAPARGQADQQHEKFTLLSNSLTPQPSLGFSEQATGHAGWKRAKAALKLDAATIPPLSWMSVQPSVKAVELCALLNHSSCRKCVVVFATAESADFFREFTAILQQRGYLLERPTWSSTAHAGRSGKVCKALWCMQAELARPWACMLAIDGWSILALEAETLAPTGLHALQGKWQLKFAV